MKVWELSSITRDHPGLLVRVAATRPEWQRFGLIYEEKNFLILVHTQERGVLDAPVDHDYALAVLRQLPQKLYLSPDHWLRAGRWEQTDQMLSLAEAYERFGGEVVEDVLEKGSRDVSPPGTSDVR